jgi:hypothetical protein
MATSTKQQQTELLSFHLPKDINREFTINCAMTGKRKREVLIEAIERFNDDCVSVRRKREFDL